MKIVTCFDRMEDFKEMIPGGYFIGVWTGVFGYLGRMGLGSYDGTSMMKSTCAKIITNGSYIEHVYYLYILYLRNTSSPSKILQKISPEQF